MSTGDPAKIEQGAEDELFTSDERLEMNSIASQAGSSRAATRKITASDTIGTNNIFRAFPKFFDR